MLAYATQRLSASFIDLSNLLKLSVILVFISWLLPVSFIYHCFCELTSVHLVIKSDSPIAKSSELIIYQENTVHITFIKTFSIFKDPKAFFYLRNLDKESYNLTLYGNVRERQVSGIILVVKKHRTKK